VLNGTRRLVKECPLVNISFQEQSGDRTYKDCFIEN
jgi:hypothetical protein